MTDKQRTPPGQVRALLSARLENGSLPPDTGQHAFSMHSDGCLCAGCDQPITDSDVKYEVERYSEDGQPAGSVSMHRDCYRMWIEESGIRRMRMLGSE